MHEDEANLQDFMEEGVVGVLDSNVFYSMYVVLEGEQNITAKLEVFIKEPSKNNPSIKRTKDMYSMILYGTEVQIIPSKTNEVVPFCTYLRDKD